jgi:hypothetical protein
MHYMQKIANLPLPTLEQTTRFADHVAVNHSWYKHLKFFPPGNAFTFFLNPHAGQEIYIPTTISKSAVVRFLAACRTLGKADVDKRMSAREVTHGDFFRHHSRLTTSQYVSQFGHWDYWVAECAHFYGDGPCIFDIEKQKLEPLPQDITERWSTGFTQFLRPVGLYRPDRFDRLRQSFLEYARGRDDDPEVTLYMQVARQLAGEDPEWSAEIKDSFAEAEAARLKEKLLRRLKMIREECSICCRPA